MICDLQITVVQIKHFRLQKFKYHILLVNVNLSWHPKNPKYKTPIVQAEKKQYFKTLRKHGEILDCSVPSNI